MCKRWLQNPSLTRKNSAHVRMMHVFQREKTCWCLRVQGLFPVVWVGAHKLANVNANANYAQTQAAKSFIDEKKLCSCMHDARFSARKNVPLGETKLIIIQYYWSEEGQIQPITAEAGRAQTNVGLIQLNRGLQQTAALHL